MDINLWISVLLAIPLAIIANLLTPRLRSWLDERSERTKRKKTEEELERQIQQLKFLQRDLEEITGYHSDRQAYHQYLLIALLRIALYGSIGGIYGGALNVMGVVTDFSGVFWKFSVVGSQAIAIFVAMLIVTTCLRGLKTHKKVKDFETYKNDSENQISDLMERIGQQEPAADAQKAARR